MQTIAFIVEAFFKGLLLLIGFLFIVAFVVSLVLAIGIGYAEMWITFAN